MILQLFLGHFELDRLVAKARNCVGLSLCLFSALILQRQRGNDQTTNAFIGNETILAEPVANAI